MTLLENWRNLAYGDGLDDKKKEELWSGYFTIEKGPLRNWLRSMIPKL